MLDIVAIAITITGVIFNFFKNPMSWVCWMIANTLWIKYFWATDENIIYMWMIFFILNCIGLYKWLRGEPK